jgi:hypothetical protein
MSTLSPVVGDHVPVGTVAILESPHVSEGPGRIANAPVPSIYVDDRGDIHRLRVGGKRINLLYSVKGVMRSGYLHPHTMHDTVISGRVEVWTLTEKETVKTIYEQYQHFTIEPYVPHILHFLEDSVVAEWWPHESDFQCWYYHPYRKIIDIQNSIMASEQATSDGTNGRGDESSGSSAKTGHHQRLVPQDEARLHASDGMFSVWGGRIMALVVVGAAASAGLVVGIVLGAALGSEALKNSTSSDSK